MRFKKRGKKIKIDVSKERPIKQQTSKKKHMQTQPAAVIFFNKKKTYALRIFTNTRVTKVFHGGK